MSLLLDEMEKSPLGKNEKKVEEARTMYSHKTGIDLLDYKNGMVIRPENDAPYLSLGIREGCYIQIVGNSGTGKSALAVKIAANIAARYENSEVIYNDLEGGVDEMRFMTISGWTPQVLREKFRRYNIGIYTEQIKAQLMKIVTKKKALKDKLLIDTGRVDYWGKPIFIYPPTIVIVDSLKILCPENLKDEVELTGNMVHSQKAKANSDLLTQLLPHIMETNVILIFVNHISKKININAYAYNPPSINYLGSDENIPGGNTALYLAHNIFKLEARARLKEDEEYGVGGFKSRLILIKSRSNRAGAYMDLIFDQVRGVRNELSNLEFLKEQGILKGTGRGYYLDEAPDVKFSRKEFSDIYREDREFRKIFDKRVRKTLKQFIPDPQKELEEAQRENEEVEEKPKKKKKK